MRLSKSLVPTLREDPADAEALSHKRMRRAGVVRQLAAGIYVWLPLGQRVLDRVNAIIREEMNAIGGQEMSMPVLPPAEIWGDSGPWDAIGPAMFRLKDRNDRGMCLGMTHEEVIAWLAARAIRSYRDLPQIWYQIQTKERDEARPRSGVLRTREFVMKDSYTLDPDVAALDRSYAAHEGAYRKIFERCGLRFRVVQSDTGMMGGLGAHEFMAPSAAGEDEIAICNGCGYAANVELARGIPEPPAFPQWTREEVATPNVKTIADVAAYLKVDPRLTIKSLLFVAPKTGPVLVLVRGDHSLHERKLARALGEEARPAHPDEVRQHLGVPVGSVGPVGVRVPVLADETLREGTFVIGANRDGVHVRGRRANRRSVRRDGPGSAAGRPRRTAWREVQGRRPARRARARHRRQRARQGGRGRDQRAPRAAARAACRPGRRRRRDTGARRPSRSAALTSNRRRRRAQTCVHRSLVLTSRKSGRCPLFYF